MVERVKRRLFEILHVAANDDPVARGVNVAIMFLILLSVVSVVLETVEAIKASHAVFFRWVEIATVAVFSAEYVIRLWVCTLDPKYSAPVAGRIRFALTGYALVDLAAIVPFYITLATRFVKVDFRFLRAARLLRFFRLFKLGRYSTSMQTLGDVFRRKKEEMVITISLVVVLITIASSIMYFVENPAQPDKFSSIPASMWWAVATLTTVGYGDIFPVTPLGKLCGAIVALLGIGLFALPAGLLGSGFIEELQKKRTRTAVTCPHCGKELQAP